MYNNIIHHIVQFISHAVISQRPYSVLDNGVALQPGTLISDTVILVCELRDTDALKPRFTVSIRVEYTFI